MTKIDNLEHGFLVQLAQYLNSFNLALIIDVDVYVHPKNRYTDCHEFRGGIFLKPVFICRSSSS